MTTTSSIENIYNEYKTTHKEGPSFTIDFYKNNSLFLDNITTFRDSEELRLYIELTWQYLNAKFGKCHYTDVVDIISKKRPLIDSEISRLDSDKLKDDWYYGIVFFGAMSSYNLKDYKTATPIFQELVNYDNKSDRYKNWLNYSIYGQRTWIMRSVYIISILLIGIQIILDKFVTPFAFKGNLLYLGLLGLVSAGLYDYYMKSQFRKTKQK
jgi:hypothetical protein